MPRDITVAAAQLGPIQKAESRQAVVARMVDLMDEAIKLDHHLHALSKRPSSKARNTVVVAGGGFPGIETATEMPLRLRAILGKDADIRVVLVERGGLIAPQTGDNPRPMIAKAIRDAGAETILGVGVTALDEVGVTLSNGQRIESATVIWTAGMRASPLTEQIPAPRDNLGRLIVDRDLRVPGVKNVFATSDTARVAADDLGNIAPMTCQFAIRLGAFARHNAAADLLGLEALPYSPPKYVTCLDLGPWGAVYTEGWEREVKMSGHEAKALKQRPEERYGSVVEFADDLRREEDRRPARERASRFGVGLRVRHDPGHAPCPVLFSSRLPCGCRSPPTSERPGS